MGIFDKINNALTGKQGDGHTTSGLDAAMQAHANEVHGWALHLPSDDQ